MPTNRKKFLYLMAMGLLALLYVTQGIMSLNTTLLYTPDSANYLGWAWSLAHLRGFTIPFIPEPTAYVTNAPLYPVLLAPLSIPFPFSVVAAKAFSLFCGVLCLILFHRYLDRLLGKGFAFGATAVLALNPLFLIFSTQVLSEIPFALCVIGVLMLGEKVFSGREIDTKPFALFLLVLSASVFLRELGIALVAAFAAIFVWKKMYKQAWITFAITASLYLLWYLRNEGFVAASVQPGLSNTRLFFAHLYSGSDASMFQEFVGRVKEHTVFYGEQLGGLLFLSQFVGQAYAVVNDADPILHVVRSVVVLIRIPVIMLSLAVLAYGFARFAKRSATGPVCIVFTVLYVAAVLLYPIADGRFLFPLLLTMVPALAYAAEGIRKWVRERHATRGIAAGVAAGLVLFLAAVPDLVWARNAAAAGWSYTRGELHPEAQTAGRNTVYEWFLPQAAEWISRNSDSTTVVMCKNEELALWLHGRDVLLLDPLITVIDFDHLIRDYHPSYLINPIEDGRWGCFDYQIAAARGYGFTLVHRIGNLELLKIGPAGGAAGPDTLFDRGSDSVRNAARSLYAFAARRMEERGPEGPREAFRALLPASGYTNNNLFYTALAAELGSQTGEAEALYARLQEIPQGGSYAIQSRGHLDILRILSQAPSMRSVQDRAAYYYEASLRYRNLGFLPRALDMLDASLRADDAYFPSLLFGAVYLFEDNDVEGAKGYLEKAKLIRPDDELVQSLSAILAAADKLRNERETSDVIGSRLLIARKLASMGLRDDAIDQALAILRLQPRNPEALQTLADLYVSKGRRGPAREALRLLCAAEPMNARAAEELKGLEIP